MSSVSTTKMSAKGQVIIPEDIRSACGFGKGAQFIVIADKDSVILKAIQPTRIEQFDSVIGRTRELARKAGIKKSDVTASINKVRGK
jgi:AbrB family looped-hinge helix DNA binding protein